MAVPIMRQYTRAAGGVGVVNVFALATDDVTGLSVQQLNKDNSIIDFVNAIQPTAAVQFQTRLFINNLEAGPTFFSSNSDPASAGRTVPGPLNISVAGGAGGKQLSYSTAQTVIGGGVEQYQFIIKYANMF
jgi:hypothetical protein|tara:strand:+ start:2406 stop:2798 length:393 start_codon:yes stop_codon:yes gene_type:complete